jgi:hypothetical protein
MPAPAISAFIVNARQVSMATSRLRVPEPATTVACASSTADIVCWFTIRTSGKIMSNVPATALAFEECQREKGGAGSILAFYGPALCHLKRDACHIP